MASKKAAQESLMLSSVLDLNEASVLHGKLMELRGRDLRIDASQVDRLGAQCIQIIVAAARTWQTDKKAFVVERASDAFEKTLQLIGLDPNQLTAKEN